MTLSTALTLCGCGCGAATKGTAFAQGHHNIARFQNWQERFWASVRVSSLDAGCWTWNGQRDRKGYGVFVIRASGDKRRYRAHRLAYVLYHGNLPDADLVCHHCDNPPCVNPAHLFRGSDADNAQDRQFKGRGRQPKGERHPAAKLTAAQVRDMRAAARSGASQRSLGKVFGVCQAQVWRVVSRKQWAHT